MKQTTKQNLMEALFVALALALFGNIIWLVYEPHMLHVALWPILAAAAWRVAIWLDNHTSYLP